jgi:hypothetical protein
MCWQTHSHEPILFLLDFNHTNRTVLAEIAAGEQVEESLMEAHRARG